MAQEIPEVLLQARSPNTNKCYGFAYARWKHWAEAYPEVTILPAQPIHIVLYLVYVAKSAKSYSVINSAVSALSWAHSLAGLETPTSNPLIIETLKGLKRKLARPSIRKEPFEREHIHSLFDLLRTESVTDVRNTLIIVLAYFAFLRVDELRHVQKQHLTVSESHVEISIPRSKCDQLRQGNTVLIARLGGKYCPVQLLEVYLKLTEKSTKVNDIESTLLFRRIQIKKTIPTLTDKDLPMSYSCIRDIIKRKATQLGLDEKLFGTHSMRAGGATTAANSLVGDRLFQKHGRWATSSSKNRYVKDSEKQRLEVSKAIG